MKIIKLTSLMSFSMREMTLTTLVRESEAGKGLDLTVYRFLSL